MTGLLIEDDPAKAEKIILFIKEFFPAVQLLSRMSYQSGLKAIFETEFDFILLDMSLPTYDQGQGNFSGKPKGYGGRDILKEMKRYRKHSRVKVITQYNEFDGGLISIKELDEQLSENFPTLYKGYIYYNLKNTSWERELETFMRSLNS